MGLTQAGITFYDLECVFQPIYKMHIEHYFRNCGLLFQHPRELSSSGLFSLTRHFKIDQVLHGFKSTFELLKRNHAKVDYSQYSEINARRVIRPTKIYENFLKRRYLFGWSEEVLVAKWVNFASNLPLRSSLSINTPEAVTMHEIDALMNWNIPIFYQRESTMYSLLPTESKVSGVRFSLAENMLRHHQLCLEGASDSVISLGKTALRFARVAKQLGLEIVKQ